MTANAEGTRELMLDAAERLFAENGIDATTVSEIHRQSGQFNKSAVHYHFGSRDGLLMAIIDRHQRRIELERETSLAHANGSLPSIVGALVRPSSSSLLTESGRRYLRVAVQLVPRLPIRALARPTCPGFAQSSGPGLGRTLALLTACLDHLDPSVRTLRVATAIQTLAETMAARAREIDVHGCEPGIEHERFVAEVETMIVGLLTGGTAEEAS